MTCKYKQENNGVCPHHNLQCGWPKCNEPEQPAQQVVDSYEKAGAYMDARLWEFIDMAAAWPKASPDPRTWDHVMVYAPKPAQRTWVGLTDDEMHECWDSPLTPLGMKHARKIEAKLKEKNGWTS